MPSKCFKSFLANNMRKTGLNGFVYDFAVDYRALDISDITNIHEYLINMI